MRADRPALMRNVELWLVRSLNVAGGVWIGGIFLLAWRFLWSQRHIGRLRLSIEASSSDLITTMPGLRRELDSACRALGLAQRPALAVSDSSPSPLVLGLRRSVIVLPNELATTAAPERLRDVLIHECAAY